MPHPLLEIEPASDNMLMTVNLGPQHPATHGTLRLRLTLDGETVVKVDPDIGFLHTGFEKLGEHLSYNQYVTVTDRMNYLSPLCNNVAFALSCEKLFGIEAPPRAQALRVILVELTRIADHVACVGLQAMDLGAFSVFLWGWEKREKLYDIFEFVTGARLTTSWTRVGGLAADVPEGFEKRVLAFCDDFLPVLDEIRLMLSRNRIFCDRTKGVGVFTPAQVKSYGVSGPIARAAGVDADVRRDHPYLGYGQYEFNVITRTEGDVYARFDARIDEMRESVRIVRQAVAKLPKGPVKTDDHKHSLPEKDRVYFNMEDLIHHFKLVMHGHGPAPARAEAYVPTEAPNGELGFYLISDGTRNAYRVRVRPPSLLNYAPFQEVVRGHLISDVVAILSSLNVIAGELDR
ncbi:MAG: NADH dehydrogenase (quinone) subunit D [Planctomycetes bacterium]|nr:NADH dehydrogenase (quinone) subunit D [Planctomycetota bacterium]